jgi:hypothetical protein
MSGGGGSQTTQNTIQKADPWSGVQPYLKGGLADLSKWYSSSAGRSYFPGSTVVPFSPFTEQALGATAQRAMDGSPVTAAAKNNITSTLNGDFLDPSSNPWLSSTYDLAAGKVRAGLDSQFNSSGGYGGSLHQGAMADNLGDLATKIYGGNYAQERSNQMQANLFAPSLANQDYFDMGQLANVGQAYEGQAKNYLDDSMARYNFAQNEPFNRLQQFFSIANPVAGQGGTTSSTTTQPTNSNSTSQTIGTLVSLASAAASIFSDPAVKTNIKPLDDDEVLARSERVPAYEYEYRKELGPKFGGLKMGPMADDFAREFGGDGHTIPMPKLMGVLWAKQNALSSKLKKLEARAA